MEDFDRLSSLPNDVICRIFAFLPYKDVVKTCVLSRRWKCRWVLSPKITLTQEPTLAPEDFIQIVRKCIDSPIKNLDYFCLEFNSGVTYAREVEDWLSLVIFNMGAKNVVLNLCLDYGRLWDVAVEERIHMFPQFPSLSNPYGHAHNLQSLTLSNMLISAQRVQLILESLPFLESLSIGHCVAVESHDINISGSPKLKYLNWGICGGGFSLKVDLINLKGFEYRGLSEDIVHINAPSLSSAAMYLDENTLADEEDIFKVLRSVCHVKSLSIFGITLEMLRGPRDVSFEALEELHVWNYNDEILMEWLLVFLRRCPLLKSLRVYTHNFPTDSDEEYQPRRLDHLEMYELNHLSEVCFNDFYATAAEVQFLEYLLLNANMLKLVRIQMSKRKTYADISRLIEALKRTSKSSADVRIKVSANISCNATFDIFGSEINRSVRVEEDIVTC